MSDASLSKLSNPSHPVTRTLTLIKLLVLAVSVAAAIPTARNLYFSWTNGVPFDQVDHRLAQAALLEKNFDCKIDYRSLSMQGNARIEVGSCNKTGDISIRVKSPNGQINYEWIAFDRLPKPKSVQSASLMPWLIASAYAGERKPLPEGSFEVAQDASVLCQAKDSNNNIIRVTQTGNQCVRETVSIFRGSVEKSESVPCATACPIK
ncbi:hypothetical protein DLM45_03100 [Hyphomicrobium methylovorum]|uniref:hypothetical protein n=1 Tax=Hyphomicrobium methylovorum TaxID=84 RepID=UPI0015E7B9DB|nr:hypothetical protein [Hyphomicrobium methylovorum]MBA2125211.1 hypothetical protein [Hyphomicrobium methylovorum]